MTEVPIPDTKLVRDIHSKALLNTDKNGLNEYLLKRDLTKKQLQEKEEYNNRILNLENDMKLIKSLLIEIKTGLDKNDN